MKAAVTTLVFCVAALLALGLVILYSSSTVQVGAHYLLKQLAWCALGLALCICAAVLDYRMLRSFALPLLATAVVLLALVLLPQVGARVGGARRWLDFGGVRFQPSEFAKVALIVGLAWYGERYQRQLRTWTRGVMIPGCMIALILALIFVEPDRGTTILLGAASGAVLVVAGVRWHYIVPPALVGIVALVCSLLYDPVRSKRIFSWLYLEENKEGVGWQAYQAMLALGSGGWFGLGLGNGRQKMGFIPEHHTDFIFSVIGEELGLVATLLVVVAFVVLILCGIYIATRAADMFGFLLAAGITFLIGLQAFINIGVVTSALPNKGLPLPFISYGGSNLLMMLASVGVLLSIARCGRTADVMLPHGEPVEAAGAAHLS